MVVPVKNLVNIHISTISIGSIHSNLCSTITMEENIIIISIRERTPGSSKNSLREASISSTISSKSYHECIEIQNLDPLLFGQVVYEYFPQSSSTNTG